MLALRHKTIKIFCMVLAVYQVHANDCIAPGSMIECSGRGHCIKSTNNESAARCLCDQRDRPDEVITGRYCECDNYTCDRHNGALCSGLENGYCFCGRCLCAEWCTGQACECPTVTDGCESPGSGVCSGNGECVCGKCRCSEGFSGSYCLPVVPTIEINEALNGLIQSFILKQ